MREVTVTASRHDGACVKRVLSREESTIVAESAWDERSELWTLLI